MVKSICKVIQHCTQENCSQEMPEESSEYSGNGALSAIPCATTPILKEDGILPTTNSVQLTGTSVCECCWKSQELNAISYSGDESEIIQSTNLKKSQSLESGLDREGILSYGMNTDDEFDQRLPLDNIHDNRFGGTVNSFDNSSTAEVCGYDDLGTNSLSQNQANVFEINADVVFNDSISPIGDMKQLDIDFYESHGEELPSDDVRLDHITTPYFFSKSCSLPRQGVYKSSLACGTLGHHRSMSLGNLCDAEVKTGLFDGPGGSHSKESFHQYGEMPFCHNVSQESNKIFEKRLLSEIDFGEECVPTGESNKCKKTMDKQEHLVTGKEDHDFDNTSNDKNASYNFITSVNIWTGPGLDCRGCENIQGEESLAEPWHELDSEDFNVKRIKEWISQINIHDHSAVQEVGESSDTFPKIKKDSHVISGANTSKLDVKGSGGIKAAYNYISSLIPISTSAQMSNLGLVVIPFLSAFSGLRELNLSGNAIVRITSGALPRGLHMLNMSRNNISIIEGLRELTRLRVLDLSYNRIFRIGHGLASCSSLKELYLAGNKIGEVEGLHRLLKLNVLDLRFNKISTVKSLGQLAANYGSLQAINLEGNPAQKNVGDDQLKKYLPSLLPRLVYFNKRIIKTSSAKDLSSHPARSATSRQYDRGMRSDDKHSRRGHHSASSHKVTSSANHSRVVQVVGPLPKLPRHRDQHAHLPIPGLKAYPLPRASGKLFSSLQMINPMRRSRSEGSL